MGRVRNIFQGERKRPAVIVLEFAERPDGGFRFVEHSPSGRVPQGF